jgi:hypothetical protein
MQEKLTGPHDNERQMAQVDREVCLLKRLFTGGSGSEAGGSRNERGIVRRQHGWAPPDGACRSESPGGLEGRWKCSRSLWRCCWARSSRV